MTLPMLMELLGVKRLGAKIPAELKAMIWQVLEHRATAEKLAEVKKIFPNTTVASIKMIPGGGAGGGG